MHDRFLAAVIADPASDAPRLVYADWLDDQPDAASRDRAAFIRMQCAAARLDWQNPAYAPLARDAERLLKRHRAAWAAPVEAALVGRPRGFGAWLNGYGYGFDRGFVNEATLPASLYHDRHAALHPAAPLRHLTLDLDAGTVADVAACPGVGTLSTLTLRTRLLESAGEMAADLAALAALGPLVELDTATHPKAPAGIGLRWARPAGRTLLTRYESVSLGDHLPAVVAALLGQIDRGRLEVARVGSVLGTEPGWPAVIERLPASLRQLRIMMATLNDDLDSLLHPLLTADCLPGLDLLDLGNCGGPTALPRLFALLASPRFGPATFLTAPWGVGDDEAVCRDLWQRLGPRLRLVGHPHA